MKLSSFSRMGRMLCFVLYALITGCNNDPSSNKSLQEREPVNVLNPTSTNQGGKLDHRIVIMVDCSRSVSQVDMDSVQSKVQQVILRAPNKTEILVFGTRHNTNETPGFTWIKKKPLKPEARKAYESTEIKQKSQEGASIVKGFFRSPTDNSCIIESLKSVYNFINGAQEARHTFLFVFSDMMECCDAVCPESPSAFKKMKEKIDSYNLGMTPLANLIHRENICVGLAAATPKQTIKNCQESSEYSDFWREVFKKFGYSDKPEYSVNINRFLSRIK